MKRWVLAAVAAFFMGGIVYETASAQDPIAARQAAMKEVGKNFGVVNRMNCGQDAFDAAAASAAFTAIATASKDYATLFPVGSETGGETEALPAIWQSKAEFDAIAMDLSTAASAAATASTDEASFKAAFSSVGKTCSACHSKYRE